jgi:hypothetical protein
MHVKGHHYAPSALTLVKNSGINVLLDCVAHRNYTDLLEKRTIPVPADIRTPQPSHSLPNLYTDVLSLGVSYRRRPVLFGNAVFCCDCTDE